MSARTLAILLFPEKDPARLAAAVAKARTLAGQLGTTATVLPPAPHLTDLIRDQLGGIATDCVMFLTADTTNDPTVLRDHLAAMDQKELAASGPIFRRGAIRSALRAPLVESEGIYDEIGAWWLATNAAASLDSCPLSSAVLPSMHTPGQALALLAFAHHFLCRCGIMPETEALRREVASRALFAWYQHRRVLPRAATHAVAAVLHQAPLLPIPRLRIGTALFVARFRPDPANRDLLDRCAAIEVCLPGMFGGRALGDVTLQPPPP